MQRPQLILSFVPCSYSLPFILPNGTHLQLFRVRSPHVLTTTFYFLLVSLEKCCSMSIFLAHQSCCSKNSEHAFLFDNFFIVGHPKLTLNYTQCLRFEEVSWYNPWLKQGHPIKQNAGWIMVFFLVLKNCNDYENLFKKWVFVSFL